MKTNTAKAPKKASAKAPQTPVFPPVMPPAVDPLLATIEAYRQGIRDFQYEARDFEIDGAALAARTYEPPLKALLEWTAPASSLAAVGEVVDFLMEGERYEDGDMTSSMLAAVQGFFDEINGGSGRLSPTFAVVACTLSVIQAELDEISGRRRAIEDAFRGRLGTEEAERELQETPYPHLCRQENVLDDLVDALHAFIRVRDAATVNDIALKIKRERLLMGSRADADHALALVRSLNLMFQEG